MSKVIEVKDCCSCPMAYQAYDIYEGADSYCNHPDNSENKTLNEYELMLTCPLKTEPITIKLISNE